MRVNFSQKERGVVFAVLEQGNSWGGSEAALLARDDLYSALKLGEFEGKEQKLVDLSDTQQRCELSREAGQHLIDSVANPQVGLGREFGRILAPVVRRVRTVLEATKPKSEPKST